MDLQALPKVVLHDHLDGGLRPATVVELAAARGYRGLPTTDAAELGAWFEQTGAGSLEGYLATFAHTIAVMQSAEEIERVAHEALVDAAEDGAVHLESRFAPSLHREDGLTRQEVLAAAARGFASASRSTGVSWGIIVDAMRQHDDSLEVVEAAIDCRDLGVVGFDLAGPEGGFPPDLHLDACLRAREANLGLTIHAGEDDGPESIRLAIQRCGAQRIGHGFRVIEDCTVIGGCIVELGPVASFVRDHRVPLEICPRSNTHTTDLTIEQHPVGMLLDAGFTVTISPDNRLMSHTSMTAEFGDLVRHHGWGPDELRAVTTNATIAAFITEPRRRDILATVAGSAA